MFVASPRLADTFSLLQHLDDLDDRFAALIAARGPVVTIGLCAGRWGGRAMEREQEELDALAFLELLGDSLRERLRGYEARTGVLSARVHVRDGEPWAVSVQFDNADQRAV